MKRCYIIACILFFGSSEINANTTPVEDHTQLTTPHFELISKVGHLWGTPMIRYADKMQEDFYEIELDYFNNHLVFSAFGSLCVTPTAEHTHYAQECGLLMGLNWHIAKTTLEIKTGMFYVNGEYSHIVSEASEPLLNHYSTVGNILDISYCYHFSKHMSFGIGVPLSVTKLYSSYGMNLSLGYVIE